MYLAFSTLVRRPNGKGGVTVIRLYVMYNLGSTLDEKEFVAWRLSDHQKSNLSLPGVLKVDFSRFEESWPAGTKPRHQFVTTMDWPDRESFDKAFYDEDFQNQLKGDLDTMNDPVFLVSEVLVNEENETGGK
jgi:hypothetical protein